MKIFKQSIRRENKFIKVDALTAELKTYNKVSGILSVWSTYRFAVCVCVWWVSIKWGMWKVSQIGRYTVYGHGVIAAD